MKKLFVCMFALLGFVVVSSANEDKYGLDNVAIDNAFNQATEISLDNFDMSSLNLLDAKMSLNSNAMSAMQGRGSNKNAFVAALIDVFLGWIGIHRMYLGSSDWMWAYYGITVCGIFGIVPLVDFIVLIVAGVQDNVGQFCNNSNYFMWM